MLYAKIYTMDKYSLYKGATQVIADSMEAYNAYKSDLEKFNVILDELIDEHYGRVCVLPEDFKY